MTYQTIIWRLIGDNAMLQGTAAVVAIRIKTGVWNSKATDYLIRQRLGQQLALHKFVLSLEVQYSTGTVMDCCGPCGNTTVPVL